MTKEKEQVCTLEVQPEAQPSDVDELLFARLSEIFARYESEGQLTQAVRDLLSKETKRPLVLTNTNAKAGGDLFSITDNKHYF